jgi:hypothetical protein
MTLVKVQPEKVLAKKLLSQLKKIGFWATLFFGALFT